MELRALHCFGKGVAEYAERMELDEVSLSSSRWGGLHGEKTPHQHVSALQSVAGRQSFLQRLNDDQSVSDVAATQLIRLVCLITTNILHSALEAHQS